MSKYQLALELTLIEVNDIVKQSIVNLLDELAWETGLKALCESNYFPLRCIVGLSHQVISALCLLPDVRACVTCNGSGLDKPLRHGFDDVQRTGVRGE